MKGEIQKRTLEVGVKTVQRSISISILQKSAIRGNPGDLHWKIKLPGEDRL